MSVGLNTPVARLPVGALDARLGPQILGLPKDLLFLS